MKTTPRTLQKKYRANQILIYQGEAPRYIYRINDGLVRAYNITADGEERTIAVYGKDDFFPVGWHFNITPVAGYFYETMGTSDLELFRERDFDEHLKTNSTEVLSVISRSYTSGMIRIDALSQKRARDKLAKTLMFLSLKLGEKANDGWVVIPQKLTQLQIAQIAGLTRETTTVELNRLKKDEIIRVRTKVYSVHQKRLLDIAGEEIAEMNL